MTTQAASKKIVLIVLVAVLTLIGVSLAAAQQATPETPTLTQSPFLGITYDPDPNGIRVSSVFPGSPAETAGIQVGDIITQIDGTAVTVRNITTIIRGHHVGDTLAVTFTRGSASQNVSVTLSARPENAIPLENSTQNGNPPSTAAPRPFLGVRVEDATAGVTVTQVLAGSPAETAGFQVGDIIKSVNGTSVSKAQDVVTAIDALNPGDQVSVVVTRSGADQTIQATLATALATAIPFGFGNGQGFGRRGLAIQYNDSDKSWTIIGISQNNALYQTGLRQGDKITQFDGMAYSPADLPAYLSGLQAGANVSLTVERGGQTQTITASVEALNALAMPGFGFFGGQGFGNGQGFGGGIPFDFSQRGVLGVQFIELNPQIAQQRGLSVTDGALITAVLPNSAAALSGLQINDIVTAVDGDKVDSERTLRDRLYAYEPGDTITLDILRGGQTQQIQVTLSQGVMSSDLPFGLVNPNPGGMGRGFLFPMTGRRGQQHQGITPAQPNI